MPTTPSFAQECDELIQTMYNGQSCLALFQLQVPFGRDQVLSTYRKLALKYHPHRNPLDKEKAEKALIIIGRAKNHLLTGEPFVNPYLPTYSSKTNRDLKKMDVTDLLEEMEMLRFNACDFNQGDLIQEIQTRILKNKNYLYTTSESGESTPLRLAMELGNAEFFKWLLQQGDNHLLSPGTVCWSPFHFLIFKNDWVMLEYIASMPEYGQEWLNQHYLHTIATRKEGPVDILNNCLAYLQQQNIPIPTTLEDNPFLINTTIGAHLQEEELLAFFKQKIKYHPGLYYLLPSELKTDPYFILSQHQVLLNSAPVDAHRTFCLLALQDLSPYFIRVLLDDLYPKIKAAAQLYKVGDYLDVDKFLEPHRFTHRSLTKEYRLCLIASITLLGLALAVACAFPAITVPGAAYAFAVALVPFLFLEAHALYGLYRKHTEKTKIMGILNENNFFKQPPDDQLPPPEGKEDAQRNLI